MLPTRNIILSVVSVDKIEINIVEKANTFLRYVLSTKIERYALTTVNASETKEGINKKYEEDICCELWGRP